jgi:hypothetical protein
MKEEMQNKTFEREKWKTIIVSPWEQEPLAISQRDPSQGRNKIKMIL